MQLAEYKTVSIWGLDIRYVEAGEGPVVLLLHGLADSLLSWYCNIDFLANAGYRVIAPDLPGYGESDKPDHLEYDPGSAADFLYEFSQELKIAKLSLVGNSAGGLIAGLFAAEHPEMVEKLVLVDSAGLRGNVTWMLRLLSLPVLGDLMYRPRFNNKIGISKRLFYHPPAVLEELLPEMYRCKLLPGARMATVKSIRSSINLLGLRRKWLILEQLRALQEQQQLPIMVIWGAEDVIIPVGHAEVASRELTQCNLQIIPECGHWPQMEKPSLFNNMLVDFLRGVTVKPEQLQS